MHLYTKIDTFRQYAWISTMLFSLIYLLFNDNPKTIERDNIRLFMIYYTICYTFCLLFHAYLITLQSFTHMRACGNTVKDVTRTI